MTSDKLFLIVALLLTAMGCAYAYIVAPTRLTVAVGPVGSPDEKLMRAFSDLLRSQSTSLRLKVRPVADILAASDALDRGEADLAIVRPDARMPVSGLSVAVLRDAAVILIVPKASGITDVGGLVGKTVGVARGFDADVALVAQVLGFFDLASPDVTIVPFGRSQVIGALKEGYIQAAAVIGPPAGGLTADLVRDAAKGFNGDIVLIPLEMPDSIAQQVPIMAAATIPAGTWVGRPRQPPEEVKTVSVSYRLMARADLDRSTVSQVVEALFQMRSRLATVARSVNLMRAPEQDSSATATSATLPNHPGAVDYFQRETQSVMDRYGDWIYLGAFFGSGLASASAWLVQRLNRHRREKMDDVLDRLLTLLSDARTAPDVARLDELAAELDGLLRSAVTCARYETSSTIRPVSLLLEGARAVVAERRGQLALAAESRLAGPAPRLVTVSS